LDKVKKQKLNDILKRKNPYLFRAKNILTPEALIRNVMDAYISSQMAAAMGEPEEKNTSMTGITINIVDKLSGSSSPETKTSLSILLSHSRMWRKSETMSLNKNMQN
jgi:hypothetical protein